MSNPSGFFGTFPQGPFSVGVDSGPSIALTPSGPVAFTANGQTIENLFITGDDSSHAVFNDGFTDCILRNCKITHTTSGVSGNYHGVRADNAHRMLIEDVDVEHVGISCPHVKEEDDIVFVNTDNMIVRRVRLTQGTTGIYILNGTGGHFSFLEGYNFRNVGDGPRGSLIQFNGHTLFTLEDFSVFNDDSHLVSFPGDCISILGDGGLVRRGLIDGNNSVSGVGLMAESVDGLTVEDVDCDNMGNGSFSNWPLGAGPACTAIVWTRVRTKNGVITDRGRGVPASGGLSFASTPANAQCLMTLGQYYNMAGSSGTVWRTGGFTALLDPANITEADFTLRSPINNHFDWE